MLGGKCVSLNTSYIVRKLMNTRLAIITSFVFLLKFMLSVKVRAKSVPLTTSYIVRKLMDNRLATITSSVFLLKFILCVGG